jgi:hypothetical protein
VPSSEREQRPADRRREAGDPDGAGGFGVGVQVGPRRLDRGEDGDAVVGQPPPGRGEPDPAPDRLQERGARLPRERGDLLRDGGRGDAHLVRHRVHRAEPGQRDQQLQAPRLHSPIMNGVCSKVTWT